MKKTARARENPSLHCKEGLKEASMATPKSFAVSTIATGIPSAKVKGVVVGCPMGRRQHVLGLSGRCHITDQSHAERRSVLSYGDQGEIILTSSAKSRALPCSRSGRSLANSRNRRGPIIDPWRTPLFALKEREKASCTRTLQERCV